MTYDNQVTLIKQSFTQDSLKNQIPVEIKSKILCGLKSVGRTEYYKAAVNDMRPDIILVVHSFEYNGEKIVEFNGARYKVLRTYGEHTEETELTCEKGL